ncbi:MAG: hypothetical protein COB22_05850 [Cycloclasticus sp.]|nr:MAG: hypothetical protein COB22_05850 [Cycloclasticus sp.]
MPDILMNIAKGRVVELYNRVENNDPANSAFIVVLLKVGETDAVLKDYDDLGALIGAAGNTEADFTNYARKVLTDAELAALPAPDDTGDKYDVTFPDITYTSAGGATNNTMVKALLCYDSDTAAGTDANIIVCGAYDYTGVTDGSNITISFPANAFSAS